MEYEQILEKARPHLGPYCKGCVVCDGRACKKCMPGPGAKGNGDSAWRNYTAWQKYGLNMDTIDSSYAVDLSVSLFGKKFSYPIFAGPIGAICLHYSDYYTDARYNDAVVSACAGAGVASFVGDGIHADMTKIATDVIKKNHGIGVPTLKPWPLSVLREKLETLKTANPFAIAMDVDAAGLPFLQNTVPPAGYKTVEELKEFATMCQRPFIVKGIMTVAGAKKAQKAGAAAIVVSNHGGRVLEGCPATAQVLPEIAAAVGDTMTVLVDGGIRSGYDVFRALALGADAVLIARPFVPMVFGAGEEGAYGYLEKLAAELADAMRMCGAKTIADITKDFIRLLS